MKSMPPTLISSNPEIMGGAWCISGTRIPAKAIWSFRDQGYDCDRIREEYPGLCNDQIYAAIEFKEPKSMTQHPPERLPLDLSREVPLNGANPIEYVLASTADEHKRQRDRLIAAAKVLHHAIDNEYEVDCVDGRFVGNIPGDVMRAWQDVHYALAECGGGCRWLTRRSGYGRSL